MFHLEPQLPNVLMSIHVEVARRQFRPDSLTPWGDAAPPKQASRRGNRLVSQLGSKLVALGERLERYELAETRL